MKLEVLHVRDCPSLPVLLARLSEVTDLEVGTKEIRSDAEAIEFGMAGSPTLLINGVDPFAESAPGDSGISCRLYRDEHGLNLSAPSLGQLRAALLAADQGQPVVAS